LESVSFKSLKESNYRGVVRGRKKRGREAEASTWQAEESKKEGHGARLGLK